MGANKLISGIGNSRIYPILEDIRNGFLIPDYIYYIIKLSNKPISEFGGNIMSDKKPKLLDRARNSLRQRNYSYKTEKSYVNWMKRYI